MPKAAAKKDPAAGPGTQAVKSASKTAKRAPASRGVKQKQEDLIFSLDIGTRTIVGVLAEKQEDLFRVLDYVVVPHAHRAMIDGQIEDIAQVAKVVKKVKTELEAKTQVKLDRVAIAAAGRALKTQHVKIDIDVSQYETITEEMVKSFEMDAIAKAQSILDEAAEEADSPVMFYCVGNSVVNYYLDDYPIKSFVGHKGKTATVDMIAAFLPSLVVESLYSVMDLNKLEVASLTLEPIAAMNVIVPPETRLINIALADIGAGTSDIAISKNGSIIAYAMATIAGDEISEEIIRRYLVDFDTAEQLKLSLSDSVLKFQDILGYEHELTSEEFLSSISPAIELLAQTITDNIKEANGGAPAAVFLVGGGSKIPTLPQLVSQKLGLPENRIAVGGYQNLKYLSVEGHEALKSPEYITPIGIGMTATLQKGYDFCTITLNDKKVRVFNSKRITILDLLNTAGYKAANIIGRSGRNLTFTLNGEPHFIKGEIATPATITVNDVPANVGTPVQQGDRVVLIPAKSGLSAEISILDLAGEISKKTVLVSEAPYPIGNIAFVNGKAVDGSYQIQNFDDVRTVKIQTVSDLRDTLPYDTVGMTFFLDGKALPEDALLQAGQELTVAEFPASSSLEEEMAADDFRDDLEEAELDESDAFEDSYGLSDFEAVPGESPAGGSAFPGWQMTGAAEETSLTSTEQAEPGEAPLPLESDPGEATGNGEPDSFIAEPPSHSITLLLNGQEVSLPLHEDGSPNMFLELAELAALDTEHPQGNGLIELLLNGQPANYADIIHHGDEAYIQWGTAPLPRILG